MATDNTKIGIKV